MIYISLLDGVLFAYDNIDYTDTLLCFVSVYMLPIFITLLAIRRVL